MATPSASNQELGWLAFAYVAGELADAEAEAFERRLAEDQSAREAVAEAVALAGAVASIRPMARRRPTRVILLGALAAAACLALAIGLSGRRPARPAPSDRVAADPAGAVAIAWSGLRQEIEPEKDDPITWLDEIEPATVEAESVADNGPPAWLLEAASLGDRTAGPQEN